MGLTTLMGEGPGVRGDDIDECRVVGGECKGGKG